MATEDDELLARATMRIGSTMREKYRIDRILGWGGMGVVYAATHRNGPRPLMGASTTDDVPDAAAADQFAIAAKSHATGFPNHDHT